MVGLSPIARTIEFRLFIFVISVKEARLRGFGGWSILESIDLIHRPEGKLIELLALAVIFGLDSLEPIRFLVLVGRIEFRSGDDILLILINGRDVCTAVHFEEEGNIVLGLPALGDFIL
jgi:hypothetical protein